MINFTLNNNNNKFWDSKKNFNKKEVSKERKKNQFYEGQKVFFLTTRKKCGYSLTLFSLLRFGRDKERQHELAHYFVEYLT